MVTLFMFRSMDPGKYQLYICLICETIRPTSKRISFADFLNGIYDSYMVYKLKYSGICLFLLCVFSCSESSLRKGQENDTFIDREQYVPEFKSLLDSLNLNGSILIYDIKEDAYFSNDFEWAAIGQLPASTFKIANSIIALETGVMENDSSLIEWDGSARRLAIWEQDLSLKEAFHYSCVPCYQEIAREIGLAQMRIFLDKLGYGVMQVDSSNLDLFWLAGASRINQYQQIEFLDALYHAELPISKRTISIMKRLMIIEKTKDYTLSGKTGWSIRNGLNNGWFVGFLETNNKIYFVDSNIEPQKGFDMNTFSSIRKPMVLEAFKRIEIID